MTNQLTSAHEHSSNHRDEVLASDICGCFYCGNTFEPSSITNWIDDEQTALCPMCGVDSVIGSQSGYPITDEFLSGMHDRFFGTIDGVPREWVEEFQNEHFT